MTNLSVASTDKISTSSHVPSAHYTYTKLNQSSQDVNSSNSHRSTTYYLERGCGYNRGRDRARSGPSNSSNSETIQGQICWKWGHSASKCYHRFDISYIGASPSPPSASPQALLAEPASTSSSDWFLDSSATTHVTYDLNNLSSRTAYSGPDMVHIGNGSSLTISHIGSSFLHTSGKPVYLHNMLHVPSITKNLLSVS